MNTLSPLLLSLLSMLSLAVLAPRPAAAMPPVTMASVQEAYQRQG